jgi:hypothetical protein
VPGTHKTGRRSRKRNRFRGKSTVKTSVMHSGEISNNKIVIVRGALKPIQIASGKTRIQEN